MLSFFVEHVSYQTYQRNRSVSPVSAIVSVAYGRACSIDACQTLINARFNERRTDANPGVFFLFESLDPSMMKPYRLVFITNVVSEGSGEPVLLCNLVG